MTATLLWHTLNTQSDSGWLLLAVLCYGALALLVADALDNS